MRGSINKPEKLKLHIEDILPLDKGTTGFTSYEFDERFIDYLMEDPEVRMGWKVGHVHSHHNMRTFFSGTDEQELMDNCPQHNFYLSLIVNNRDEFEARVAIYSTGNMPSTVVLFKATNEKGQEYIIDKISYVVKEEAMYWYDTEIRFPKTLKKVDDKFSEKVEELFKPKVIIPVVPITPVKSYVAPFITLPKTPLTKQVVDRIAFTKTFNKSFVYPVNALFDIEEILTNFAILLFKTALEKTEDVKLEDLEDLEDVYMALEEIDPIEIAQTVGDNYAEVYAELFADETLDEDFIDYTEQLVIFLGETLVGYSDITNPTIVLLKAIVRKFKENGTKI
jgi:hypothetical protein